MWASIFDSKLSAHYSWASGCNPWGNDKETRFTKPSHHDRKLEVIGLTGVAHLARIQSRAGTGIRIAQGGSVRARAYMCVATVCVQIRITTHQEMPVQVDGEPQMAAAGTITILKSALKVGVSQIVGRNAQPSQ
jgi:diacylglycerol kinase (ATP)